MEEKKSRQHRRIIKHTLLLRVLVTNSSLLLLEIIVAVWATRHWPACPDIGIMAALGVSGLCCMGIANYLIVRIYSQPLREILRAVELLNRGFQSSSDTPVTADPAIRNVIRSVHEAIGRLEDDSLRHTAQLLNSIEEERQRIGRELHDQTSQTLATALVMLNLAEQCPDEDAALKQIAAAKQLVGQSLEQIKVTVYDLRPVMLDDLGLVPTLRWHIKTHLSGTGIVVTTDFEETDRRLPRPLETTLFRVAQEVLANVVKHSQASRVWIRLELKPAYATFTISDNGRGFDLNRVISGRPQACHSQGLWIILERIKLVGGTINIQSKPETGTHIYIVVPFSPLSPDPLNNPGGQS